MSSEHDFRNEYGVFDQDRATEAVLRWAVDSEQVIEIPDFDFYLFQNDSATRDFEMDDKCKIKIAQSPEAGKTIRLSISHIPTEEKSKIYLLGYEDVDSSAYMDARFQIYDDKTSEEQEYFENGGTTTGIRTDFDIYNPFNPFGGREIVSWDIENKYNHILENLDIPATFLLKSGFITLGKNDGVAEETVFDFDTNTRSGSLFLPYKPLEFEAFKDKTILRLFLSFLSDEKRLINFWADYFSKNKDQFPLQAQLAISSRIQTVLTESTN